MSLVSRTTSVLVVAILLAGMPVLSGCASEEEKKAEHLKKGIAYFDKGEFKNAEIELRNAIQIDPLSAPGRNLPQAR
jgi:Tfp pilus assembly protein PilF